ncbi:hypothetical protein ONE63_008263 [Megalurothrips usitatus]|uniref:DUF4802 domain-containing protein n=1 Tax=Megalurothrips usitatus TaxID=439358 RepID=A0AAV7XT57_9NEOP|nr:hypothetical protein ONE63_008263 [Megalurothrips usitatus]
MSPGVVKQSSTSSCCSALSWTGSESSQHSQGTVHAAMSGVSTPTHSGSMPYLPPPSYEKALQEGDEDEEAAAQQQQQQQQQLEERQDREDGYETLGHHHHHGHHHQLQRDGSSSSSHDNVEIVDIPVQGPIILHKSSKALYRASRYFDCDYDMNEEGKTDGGLGATSPIFLQEVMHGTACTIL